MAYAFNDDKSKNHLNGIATIPISTSVSGRTIQPGETKWLAFSADSINNDDVLGILGVWLFDVDGVVPGIIISFIDFDDAAVNRVNFRISITNPTNNSVKLSSSCLVKVRTIA